MALLTLNRALKVHRLFQWPAMTRLEVKVYKKILKSLYDGRSLDIFEYGSGYSTLYFAKFMREQNMNFHIDAIDNHPGWYARVGNLMKDNGFEGNVTLHLHEFTPFWEKEGWSWDAPPALGKFAPSSKSELDYINKPLTLNKKFDLIVVDARFRRRCLEVAAQALKSNGIALLHDAERVHYHPTTKLYPQSRFIESGHFFPFEKLDHRMWLGSFNNPLVQDPSLVS